MNKKVELTDEQIAARDPSYSFQELLDREKVDVPDSLRDSTETYLGSEDLPVERYTSREFFDLEAEKLWTRAWQMTYEAIVLVLAHRQDTVRRGIELLEKAVALDSDYALAWSTLTTGHWKEAMNRNWSGSRSQSLDLAQQCSDKAIAREQQLRLRIG